MSQERPPGQIITFYSYKGGTGRTMLLANVAWILASAGKSVLAIDWDLEAPGLHYYFHPFLIDKSLADSDGVIDIIEHFVESAVTPFDSGEDKKVWLDDVTDVRRRVVGLNWQFGSGGRLDFLPAGRQDPSYSVRVNTFDWRHFYEELDGGAFLERVKRRLCEDYEYVLIDSRTGSSDTSGICTVVMPDRLVACFTGNEQSIRGAYGVVQSVKNQWDQIDNRMRANPSTAGPPPERRIFPVLTRVEQAEKDKLEAAQDLARQLFDPIIETMAASSPDDYWQRVRVFYVPYYAYEEVLAAFGDKQNVVGSVIAACETVAGLLTHPEVMRFELPTPEKRERVLPLYERKAASRRPDALILIGPKDWNDTVRPLEELRELGLRVMAIDWQEWLKQIAEPSGAAAARIPLVLVVGRSGLVDAPPGFVDRIREASTARKVLVLLLSSAPGDRDLPDTEQWPRADLRGAPDIAEALVPLELGIREGRIPDKSDPRIEKHRRRRRLAADAKEWLDNNKNDDFLWGGAQLDSYNSWLKEITGELKPTEREFVDASRFARDEAAATAQLEQAKETAARAQEGWAQTEKRLALAEAHLDDAQKELRQALLQQGISSREVEQDKAERFVLDTTADRQAVWSATATALKIRLDLVRWLMSVTSIFGALLAAIASQVDGEPRIILAILGSAFLASALFLSSRTLDRKQAVRWVGARAASEGLKSEAFKYATSASPYDDTATRDALLVKHREQIERDVDDLLSEVVPAASAGSAPRAALARGEYVEKRILGQVRYLYVAGAEGHRRKAMNLRSLQVALPIGAAILTAVVGVSGKAPFGISFDFLALTAVLTTIAAAVFAYIEASRYNVRATTYLATARQLRSELASVGDVSALAAPDWSAFVQRCEEIMAAENNMWLS